MEYVLLHVDDCLVVSQHLEEVLGRLGKYFPSQPGSVGPDKLYLGGKLSKLELPNDVHAWAISASKYIHQASKNLEPILDMHGLKLRHNTNSTLPQHPWYNIIQGGGSHKLLKCIRLGCSQETLF